MKIYRLFRGLLKASAFTTVMFIMQACYGAPHPMEDFNYEEEEATEMNDSIQEVEPETPSVIKAE